MRNLSFALPLLLVAGSFVSVPSAQSGVSGGPVDPWPHGDPPRYRVRDVSPSRPVAEVGMNIFGHVGSSDEEEAPFVWVNGRIRWLPMYPGSDDCAVLDVNDLGEAVGGARTFPPTSPSSGGMTPTSPSTSTGGRAGRPVRSTTVRRSPELTR